MTADDPFISLRCVSKYFQGVRALEGVNLDCYRGSIHAIIGENGAGKSTLIKIISGVLQPDHGSIHLDGKTVVIRTPAEARRLGIACIFQELSLIPDLTVAENISLANPPKRLGLINKKPERQTAEALLAHIKCEDIDPDMLVKKLSLSRRQMVEIAKALNSDPALLILDEATSALTDKDVQTLYDLLEKLKAGNMGCLFISHRMHEVETLCNTLSVFRNGTHVETFKKGDKSNREIVRLMIGRDVESQFLPKLEVSGNDPVITISDLKWEQRLKGINLSIKKGEIVGLGGLGGQGQNELLLALFGALRGVSGNILLSGENGMQSSPSEAKSGKVRMALVPEDRKTEGLMLKMSIRDNLLAAAYSQVSRFGFIAPARAEEAIKTAIEKLQIKLVKDSDSVATLSGGNQQKVVIAKWLMIAPDVILLNDPTRGIDVGTKQEIYALMRTLAEEGKAILFYSTDYAELIGCCNRVSIIYDGRVVSELEGEDITEEAIVAASLNIELESAA